LVRKEHRWCRSQTSKSALLGDQETKYLPRRGELERHHFGLDVSSKEGFRSTISQERRGHGKGQKYSSRSLRQSQTIIPKNCAKFKGVSGRPESRRIQGKGERDCDKRESVDVPSGGRDGKPSSSVRKAWRQKDLTRAKGNK